MLALCNLLIAETDTNQIDKYLIAQTVQHCKHGLHLTFFILISVTYHLRKTLLWVVLSVPGRNPFAILFRAFFQKFWEKAPGRNWEKMIDLTSNFGEINYIEHNKGSKIYAQNQVFLDCIMSSTSV